MHAPDDYSAIYARSLLTYDGPLSPRVLLAEAEQATGLADWGGAHWAEDGFRERLHALCESMEGEAKLTALGRTRAHGRMHMMLCSRLRFIAWPRSAARQAPIVAPLIGTGFPRAGTSFLHQLLAQDPENMSVSTAQAGLPVPPPGPDVDEAKRNAFTDRLLDFQGLFAPDVDAVHPFAADAPDECTAIQESSCGSLYQAFFNVPSFLPVAFGAVDDAFAWQKGMLQLLQADQPASRWVLKTPQHMHHWDSMIATFPDARVFMNHRDPGKMIASIGNLFVTFRRLNSDSPVDPKALGRPALEGLIASMERVTAWRAAHPEFPVVDVHYKTLVADPIAEAERVYSAFGLTLSATARERMSSFLKVNRHGQVGGRRYTLADVGLDEAAIEAICGDYIDKFGVTREERV